jgi:hypothetical protein
MNAANRSYVQRQRARRPRNVSTDECDAMLACQRQEAVEDAVDRRQIDVVGEQQRQQRTAWLGAHRGEVAQIDGQRTVTDRIERHEAAVEVHAIDDRVGRQHVVHAAHRRDNGRVVTRSDGDPWSCGEAGGNPLNEGPLAEAG